MEGNLGTVYINETQYFSNVPELAWNFYIGGYQPAQKWLKDRKGRELRYEGYDLKQIMLQSFTEKKGLTALIPHKRGSFIKKQCLGFQVWAFFVLKRTKLKSLVRFKRINSVDPAKGRLTKK